MADPPAPIRPGYVTIPESEFRALEEKARALPGPSEPAEVQAILKDLLVAVDHFERAIESARREESYPRMIEGLETIHAGLIQILGRHRCEKISTVGEAFHPLRHEVLEDDPPAEGATITEELRAGYEWGGRVFRRAWVRVAPDPPGSGSPPDRGHPRG